MIKFVFTCGLLLSLFLAVAAEPDDLCESAFPQLLPGTNGNFFPRLSDVALPARPDIYILSKENASIGVPGQVDVAKQKMLEGSFGYGEPANVISGVYHEPSQTYFVSEGHHRLAAALEIANETGNWSPFKRLVQFGHWDTVAALPHKRSPLPTRDGSQVSKDFLRPITPGWRHFGWRALLE